MPIGGTINNTNITNNRRDTFFGLFDAWSKSGNTSINGIYLFNGGCYLTFDYTNLTIGIFSAFVNCILKIGTPCGCNFTRFYFKVFYPYISPINSFYINKIIYILLFLCIFCYVKCMLEITPLVICCWFNNYVFRITHINSKTNWGILTTFNPSGNGILTGDRRDNIRYPHSSSITLWTNQIEAMQRHLPFNSRRWI